jgi:hypothetical protein
MCGTPEPDLISTWKQSHPEFSESIKAGKSGAASWHPEFLQSIKKGKAKADALVSRREVSKLVSSESWLPSWLPRNRAMCCTPRHPMARQYPSAISSLVSMEKPVTKASVTSLVTRENAVPERQRKSPGAG